MNLKSILLGALFLAFVPIQPTYAQLQLPEDICSEVVSRMVPQFITGIKTSDLARIEIRKCPQSEALLLIGYEKGQKVPNLRIDTTDWVINQMLMSGYVFAIETTGGSRNQIYVINYVRGKPELALQRVIKDSAKLTSDGQNIKVSIPIVGSNNLEEFSYPVDAH
jgi:hypothetical protein